MRNDINTPAIGRPINESARCDRRNQILSGARKCFVAKGFHAATMSEIARAAKVSNANIYQYYIDKDDLICALIRQQIEFDASVIGAIARTDFKSEGVRNVLGPIFSSSLGRDNAVLMCERFSMSSRSKPIGSLSAAAEVNALHLLEKAIRNGQDRGVISSDVNPSAASHSLISSFDGVQLQLLVPGHDPSFLIEMIIRQIDLVLKRAV